MEDLLEIERKSSLLASAIDDTIKSIELYKEEVGIQNVSKESVSSSETKERKRVEFKEESETEITSNFQEASSFLMTETATQNEMQSSDTIETTSLTRDAENTMKRTHDSTSAEIDTETRHLTAKSLKSRLDNATSIENELSSSVIDSLQVQNTDTVASTSKQCYQSSETVNKTAIQESFDLQSQMMSEHSRLLETNEETSRYLGREVQAAARSEDLVVDGQRSGDDGATRGEINLEVLGTTKGIVNGIAAEALVDEEVANLGKPGMTEDEIAELISGESEMLREAHVMGVDFKKIKPTIDSLKDSEVLKVLNEDLTKTKAEKKAEERKWTTFLQRPVRPVPKARFGYYRNISNEEPKPEETYKVKIVKQPKPKVAPDYRPQDFETGPLPWEERAANEPPPPPIPRQDPILVPEEVPQYLEAVDPLPESEVPDLEETGIPLPLEKESTPFEEEEVIETAEENQEETPATILEEVEGELDLEKIVEETEQIAEEMEQTKLADQILQNIQSMVDPGAPLDQQLAQMRAQLAALAVLPGVIQNTLQLVTDELNTLTSQDCIKSSTLESHQKLESSANIEVTETHHVNKERHEDTFKHENNSYGIVEEETSTSLHEVEHSSRMEAKEEISSHVETAMLVEEQTMEKQKDQAERSHLELESQQTKQFPAAGAPPKRKPAPAFGPLTPQERPLVLPGGRRWRTPRDAYNDQFIAETLSAQAEIIQGKAKGLPYESALLGYDERINFMKYEKPPVSLDHLKQSEVFKVVHDMDEGPTRRVELLTPALSESDYREKCRSVTPCRDGVRLDTPQQMQL